MKEGDLSKKLVELVRKRGGWARKVHQGRFGSGLPDVIGMYRGYGLFLEVKLPGREKTLTKLQKQVLDEIEAAGGLSRMVTSVQQVELILHAIDKKANRKLRK